MFKSLQYRPISAVIKDHIKNLIGLKENSQALRSAANCTQAIALGEIFGCPAGGAAVPLVRAWGPQSRSASASVFCPAGQSHTAFSLLL